MARERKRTQSSGTLLYRDGPHRVEVLIVHPSGWYNRAAPWSIPKGVANDGEALEDAGRREELRGRGAGYVALHPFRQRERWRDHRRQVEGCEYREAVTSGEQGVGDRRDRAR